MILMLKRIYQYLILNINNALEIFSVHPSFISCIMQNEVLQEQLVIVTIATVNQ